MTNSTTTIELKRMTKDRLRKYRDPVTDRNDSDVIERVLDELERTDVDIYVKIMTIDGFLADSADHEVVFQLGDNPPRYYRYYKGKMEALDPLPKIRTEIVE